MKKEKDYSIGIDIGTASVGWSVVNNNAQLIRFKGRKMWGTRLFDNASSAQERRVFRSSRRRYNKRRERLNWLDTFFMDEVKKVDINFKIRLQQLSFLDLEDKQKILVNSKKDNLFYGNMSDKEYFKRYPTIYHLRNELCECKEKIDPRLIYLAMHHIIKYRGNFLYEGQEFTLENSGINSNIMSLFECVENVFGYELYPTSIQQTEFISIIKKNTSKRDKLNELMKLNFIPKESNIKEAFKAMIGQKSSLGKIFEGDYLNKDGKELVLEFASSTYEETIDEITQILTEEQYALITLLHQIYSWIILQDMLNGEDSISKAMINKYNQHQHDLKSLKYILRKYDSKSYYAVFKEKGKDTKAKTYYNYIHHPKNVSQEEICKTLEKILNDIKIKDELVETLLIKAINRTLLPKQNSVDNGVIPYQLHLYELNKIIENQGDYYPTLIINKERLCKLVSFRYPYYIGPLSTNSPFAWLVKGKSEERITPWNLEETIDVDASAAEFIYRMINHCTYFPKEYVLPKKSLYITKYEVLSEVNKIRINGNLLSISDKQKLIQDVFMKHSIVKEKHLIEFIKKNQLVLNTHSLEITGYQKEKQFASSMDSWIKFSDVFGTINKENIEIIENLILWLTVYEDKEIARRKIDKEYPHLRDKISMILNIKCTGWSQLSKRLLVDELSNGENILDIMERTNLNLMQIINDKQFMFKNIIDNALRLNGDGISYEDIKDLQGSPAIKRGIWQAIKVIQEIIKVMHCEPKQIFIEFAREDGNKKRTSPQVKKLQDIYQIIKADNEIYNAEIDHQLQKLDSKTRLDNERLYLYYIQQGKCLYSGLPLDLEKLNTYQIDHILPRSLIKDDSIENKALVVAEFNQHKKDYLLIDRDIIDKQKTWWKQLMDYGLIGAKKFYNLTRLEYSKKEQEGFIERQLVETRQITKHVTQLLQVAYPNVDIVSIKANLSHDFREKYELYKVRELNDAHHAQDAYIASLLGQYLLKRYPKMDRELIYGQFNKFKKERNNSKEGYGFILSGMNNKLCNADTGEIIWNPEQQLGYINKIFYCKDYFISKKLEPQTGSMFNLTIRPNQKNSLKGKIEAQLPVNKNRADVLKYGGFQGLQQAYYLVVEYMFKKKIKRDLVGIPIYKMKQNQDQILLYLKTILETDNVKILSKPIYKYQLIRCDKQYFYIVSDQEVINARQLFLLKHIVKKIVDMKKHLISSVNSNLSHEDFIITYDYLIEKMKNFNPRFTKVSLDLEQNREIYKQIPNSSKIKVILEILKMLRSSSENANLKEIGLAERVGRLSSFKFDLNNLIFVNQSVTGMYEEEETYDLANSNDNKTM